MELACYPNSILSEEVERRFGKGSAIRCSDWNGCDLETEKGVSLAISILPKQKPMHLWIACECSPFCPLQRLNRGTPEKAAALEEKQRRARKQYGGAFRVAKAAKKIGTQVHWELSERCEAWKLPLIEDVVWTLGLRRAPTRDVVLVCVLWTSLFF